MSYLSIIVPAFNEERRIAMTLLDMIDWLDGKKLDYEILVVNDGSSDRTDSVVKKFMRVRHQIKLIKLPENQGKGAAVCRGMHEASGELALFADADGATPFKEINRLLEALQSGADIAIGSRAMASGDTSIETRWYRKYLGRIFNFFVNILVLPNITDTQCGFKLFSEEARSFIFPRITSKGFSFDVEALLIARKAGFKIREMPINWTNIPGSKVNLISDSLKMFRDILRFRIIHRGISEKDRSGGLN